MAHTVVLTTYEVFAMFSMMPDIDVNTLLDSPEKGALTEVIYKARAAQAYQQRTGDLAVNIIISGERS